MASPIAALGLPGALSVCGFNLMTVLLDCAEQPYCVAVVDRFDETDVDHVSGRSIAFYQSLFPSRAFMRGFAAAGGRAVVFLDDPFDAVRFLMSATTISFLEAVRSVSLSLALLNELSQDVPTLFVPREILPEASTLADRLSDFLQLNLSTDHVHEALKRLGWDADQEGLEQALSRLMPASDQNMQSEVVEDVELSSTSKATLPDEDRDLIERVLVPARAQLVQGHDQTIIWPWQSFFSGDKPNETAPIVVDVVGPARIIYYGPYFHLAAGTWSARVLLGFTKEAIGLPFTLEASSNGTIGYARIFPTAKGVFACRLTLHVTEPEHGIELRIMSDEGAIEGRVGLGQVELTRVSTETRREEKFSL